MKLIDTIKDTLAERHEARAIERQLERELSAYHSPADLLELDAIIARYPEEDTVLLRNVLTRRAMSAAA